MRLVRRSRVPHRVLVPEVGMILAAVVVEFGLALEAQYAFRALMDGH